MITVAVGIIFYFVLFLKIAFHAFALENIRCGCVKGDCALLFTPAVFIYISPSFSPT